jgi:hypothetical protein
MSSNLYRIDGVLWEVKMSPFNNRTGDAVPICPKHHLRMESIDHTSSFYSEMSAKHLRCEECDEDVEMPRGYHYECRYVIDKVASKKYKEMDVMNIDGESVPIAEAKAEPKDSKYFATARLMKSKVGLRLVVYAGQKGKKQKTQIFVEPEVKRLSFDHGDVHPSEVFVALEGTFADGTKGKIERKKKL